MSVLVIEDDRALRVLLEAVLARNAIATNIVARGDDALKAILAGVYDAIVLDLLLPGLNGFEILQAVQARQPHLLSRVIVLTAVSSGTLRNLELIWKVIRKPFDINEFIATVLDCIACHSGRMRPNRAAFARWFEKRSALLNARTGVVATPIDHSLQLHAEFGDAAGVATSAFPVQVDRDYPLAVAFRRETPVWLASLTRASAEYPLLTIWTANGGQAIAALPLGRERQLMGAMGLSFDQPQAFDGSQRDAISQIAAECLAILEHDVDRDTSQP